MAQGSGSVLRLTGYEFSQDVDDQGRRLLIPLAHEQEVLRNRPGTRQGLKLHQIARRPNEAGFLRGGMASGERSDSASRWYRDGTKPVLPIEAMLEPRIPLRPATAKWRRR